MRGAVRGVTPLRNTRMREYNFSAHFRIGRGARIVLTIDNTVTQPLENWNSKLRMIRSVKFARMREQIRMTLKTP
jgi:hypothetical protein